MNFSVSVDCRHVSKMNKESLIFRMDAIMGEGETDA